MLLLRSKAMARLTGLPARSAAARIVPTQTRNVRRQVAMTEGSTAVEPVPRSFPRFSVYKGRSAAQFKMIPPTFKYFASNETGSNGYALEKEGVVLLELAPANDQAGQSSYGARTYNWSEKVTFALSALELAQITDLDHSGAASVDLFHDSSKARPNANGPKISKSLKFTLGQTSGYQLLVNQSIGSSKKSVSVPLTRQEYVVLQHLAAYAVPRLYGFDYLFEGQGEPLNVVNDAGGYAGDAGAN